MKIGFTGAGGTGKEQPLYAKVLTPDGFVAMGDMQVGMTVVTPSGTAKVRGVYPQGRKQVYRVHFRDGFYADCGIDHLWAVSRGKGFVVKPLHAFKDDIKAAPRVDRRSGNAYTQYRNKIPVFVAEFPERELPLDPYLVGYLIANGSLATNTPKLSLHASDADELITKLEPTLPEGVLFSGRRNTSENGVQVNMSSGGVGENRLAKILSGLCLNQKSSDKRIPQEYLYASSENRLQLLRGLMDGDGSVTNNRTSYSTKNAGLRDDVCHLVQSLGGVAVRREYDRGERGVDYEVNVKMPVNPFDMNRKASKWTYSSKNPPSRYIVDVEELGYEEQQCISLDDGIGLYFTDNFIVTHNTTALGLVREKLTELPVLPSPARAVFARWGINEVDQENMTVEDRIRLQDEIYQARFQQEQETPEFISDRTLLDNFAYHIARCYAGLSDPDFTACRDRTIENLKTYDLIFYFPLLPVIEVDGMRFSNLSYQTMIDGLIFSFLEKNNIPYLRVPDGTAEEKAGYILESITWEIL